MIPSNFDIEIFYDRLTDRDVILMGGSSSLDGWKPTKKERTDYFFVQLNHHLFRRESLQPCDWLIARQGSGMTSDTYQKLRAETKQRTSLLSVQIDHPVVFQGWQDVPGLTIFPFFEKPRLRCNPYSPALEWCNQFLNELRTNPFVGVLALKMILLFPVRSVKLRGFNFFKDKNASLRKNIGCHNVRLQVDWLAKMYHTDFRIELEPELLSLLDVKTRGLIDTFEA